MQSGTEESNLDTRVRAEIKAEMGRQDMTATRLAKILGRPQTYMSRRLRGEVNFSLSEVERIAQVLGVSLEQLMPSAIWRSRRKAS